MIYTRILSQVNDKRDHWIAVFLGERQVGTELRESSWITPPPAGTTSATRVITVARVRAKGRVLRVGLGHRPEGSEVAYHRNSLVGAWRR